MLIRQKSPPLTSLFRPSEKLGTHSTSRAMVPANWMKTQRVQFHPSPTSHTPLQKPLNPSDRHWAAVQSLTVCSRSVCRSPDNDYHLCTQTLFQMPADFFYIRELKSQFLITGCALEIVQSRRAEKACFLLFLNPWPTSQHTPRHITDAEFVKTKINIDFSF